MIGAWDVTDQDGSVTELLNGECTTTIHSSKESLETELGTDKRQFEYRPIVMWLTYDRSEMDTRSTPRDNMASILLNLVSKSSF